jgi:hypothetical protein
MGASNGGSTAMGTTVPDFSTLTTSLSQLASQEGQLVSAITTPPPAATTAQTAPDYSNYGPYANAIAADYQAALGRAPEFSGLTAWDNAASNLIASGQTPQQAQATIATQIGNSAEAQQYQKTGKGAPGSVNSSGFFTNTPVKAA